MDEVEALQRLSMSPLPCNTLALAEASWQKIKSRYPRNGRCDPAAAQWVEYASRVSQLPLGDEGDGAYISPAMHRLASGEHIDSETMEACLALLRSDESTRTKIAGIRPLAQEINDISAEGLDYPSIVPFQDGEGWAFAVAYPDCIHWYDSRHGVDLPKLYAGKRRLVAEWTGPKQPQDRPEDSGVLMLLGIRRIHQGAPHLSQGMADQVRPSFRARLVAELLCGKTEPSEEEFSAIVPQQGDELSFFADAYHGIELATPDMQPSRTTQDSSSPSLSRSPSAARTDAGLGHARMATTPPRPDQLTVPRHRAQPLTDVRRLILGHLSDAVLARRALQASSQTSLAVLWEAVRRGAVGSAFHERYNAILFHDRMEALEGREAVVRAMSHPVNLHCLREMRLTQARCRFWRDICDARHEWGQRKYVLLLSVPRISSPRSMRESEKNQVISGLRSRLDDPSDPLEGWLMQAWQLCAEIVADQLPGESLMIDTYHLKRHETITDADYEAFTSVDPRHKMALPRQSVPAVGRSRREHET